MIIRVLLSLRRVIGGIKGDGAVHQRREAIQLDLRAAQADICFHAGDVPETALFFHQVRETALDQYVNRDALIVRVNSVVIHPADRNFAEIDQRAAG